MVLQSLLLESSSHESTKQEGTNYYRTCNSKKKNDNRNWNHFYSFFQSSYFIIHADYAKIDLDHANG